MGSPTAQQQLAGQAGYLQEGVDAFMHVTKDATQLLARLARDLGKLNHVAQPIYNQAARLAFAQQNIGLAKTATDQLLVHLNTAKKLEAALRQGPGRDLPAYQGLLGQLQAAMQALEQHPMLSVAQQAYEYCGMVQQQALQDCEADFVAVLSQQTTAALPSSSALSHALEQGGLQAVVLEARMPPFTPAALQRLKALAGLLDTNHSTTSCAQEYVQVRSKALQHLLQGGGGLIAPLNTTNAATHSLEQADKAAAQWGHQLRMLAAAVSCEVALAQAVWGAQLAPELAGSIAVPRLKQVIKQCEEVSRLRLQPVKVFVLLDMMQHLEEVVPVLEGLLRDAGPECEEPLLELHAAQQALAGTARELFVAFEAGVAKDSSKAQAVDGTVHPFTAATLSHLRRLLSYGPVAQVLFVERGRGGGGLAELSEQVAARKLQDAVRSCMAGLLQALRTKSKSYKSKALAQVFLMNNIHFMVTTSEGCDLVGVLGRRWLEEHRDLIEQCGQAYHHLVWMPTVEQLRDVQAGKDAPPSETSQWKEWIKKHFKTVNSLIEKVGNEQSGWSIPDDRLRGAVVRVILQDFLPPYTHFWNTYSRADFTSQRNKHVRCSPDDVQRIVSGELFKGVACTVTLMPTRTSMPSGVKPSSPTGTRGGGDSRRTLPTVAEPPRSSVHRSSRATTRSRLAPQPSTSPDEDQDDDDDEDAGGDLT